MATRAEPYTADELRMWRAKLHKSQTDMATLFAISQRLYSHWEAGRTPKDFNDRFEQALVAYYSMEDVK